jgi:hypothetical protein
MRMRRGSSRRWRRAAAAGWAAPWPSSVLGTRPHIRPLLVALQRCPAHRVVVVDEQHAWLYSVAGDEPPDEAWIIFTSGTTGTRRAWP